MTDRDSGALNRHRNLYCLDMEQLEALLKLYTGMEPDEEDGFLTCVLDAMERNEREHPSGRIPSMDQAWSDFIQFYEADAGDLDRISYLAGAEDCGGM